MSSTVHPDPESWMKFETGDHPRASQSVRSLAGRRSQVFRLVGSSGGRRCRFKKASKSKSRAAAAAACARGAAAAAAASARVEQQQIGRAHV